mgnify:FL=1|jgi:hypothetical protein
METIVKINIAEMKDGIKKAAETQKFYRNQRKTVHIKGDRLMSASDATYEHRRNGEKLRIMYAAYGLARGKSFSQIENSHPEENHPLNKYQYQIDKLLKQYEMKDAE